MEHKERKKCGRKRIDVMDKKIQFTLCLSPNDIIKCGGIKQVKKFANKGIRDYLNSIE